jgi:hypothetical protein
MHLLMPAQWSSGGRKEATTTLTRPPASKVLSMAARRLPADWQQRYGFAPVLLETFVESPRHKGS